MKLTNLFIILPLVFTYTFQDLRVTAVSHYTRLATNTRATLCVLRKKGTEYTKKYAVPVCKKVCCCLNHAKTKASNLFAKIYGKLRGRKEEREELKKLNEDEPSPNETFDINEFMKMLEELQKYSKDNMNNDDNISGDEGYASEKESDMDDKSEEESEHKEEEEEEKKEL